jgi:hypothetical protein
MKHLHQTWDIKIWTSWEEIELELVTRPYMLKYIQNPYCNAANKSDCLRFHILEKYGGVWVDLSTYFIKSLDDLYDKYNTAFTTFYMPPYDALMWSIKPFSDKYEQISVKEKVNNIYPNLYKIVTKSNDFVCESYFIMSPPHHPIVIDVLKQMENTWSLNKVEKIIDTKTHCSYLNLVMNNLDNITSIRSSGICGITVSNTPYTCGISEKNLSDGVDFFTSGQCPPIIKNPSAKPGAQCPTLCTSGQSCADGSCKCAVGFRCGEYSDRCCSEDCTNHFCNGMNECGEKCLCSGEGQYCDQGRCLPCKTDKDCSWLGQNCNTATGQCVDKSFSNFNY